MSLLDKDSLSEAIKALNNTLNIDGSSLTEEEIKDSEYISEDPDILYTGGIADLKEQIRKSGIVEQMLSGTYSLHDNKSYKHETTTPKDINRANHLISLSDKELFKHFSIERHKRILKPDEV
ncbi:hypothetical protein, partial [Vibrio vulnificus]